MFLIFLVLFLSCLRADQGINAIFEIENITPEFKIGISQSMLWKFSALADVSYRVNISLEEVYYGAKFDAQYNIYVPNPTCIPSKCALCHGVGHVFANKTCSVNEVLSSKMPCPECMGLGVTFPKDCSTQYLLKQMIIPVDLEPGYFPGSTLKIEGKENQLFLGSSVTIGSLIILIEHVYNSNDKTLKFLFEGPDILVFLLPLHVEEAVFGFNRTISIFGSKYLEISRQEKVTIPSSNESIACLGPPTRNTCIEEEKNISHYLPSVLDKNILINPQTCCSLRGFMHSLLRIHFILEEDDCKIGHNTEDDWNINDRNGSPFIVHNTSSRNKKELCKYVRLLEQKARNRI